MQRDRKLIMGILVYFWLLVYIFDFLPVFLSDTHINFLTFGCIGYLFSSYFGDDQEYVEELEAKLSSPRLLTNWGAITWDGITYRTYHNNEPYCIFYQGMNSGGYFDRGNLAVICPERHVKVVNKNRIIMSDLRRNGPIAHEVRDFVVGYTNWLIGHLPAPEFEYGLSAEEIDIQRQLDSQISLNNTMIDNNSQVSKLISDNAMLGAVMNIGNDGGFDEDDDED